MSSASLKSKTQKIHSPPPPKSIRRRGLLDMAFACLLFSTMNASVYAISLADPGLPAITVSFIRVLFNLMVLMMPAMLGGIRLLSLFGDFRPSLWLRGLFGASALMLSFAAISRIGPGESGFLTACNGVFIALLAPLLLGQRHSLLGWLAIIGSFAGVSLLFLPVGGPADLAGRAMALGSGFLMALAYLMVARAGRSNSPASVIFYFCLVALFLHAGYFALFGFVLPDLDKTWGLLIFTGLSGSAAQHFMTRAYQAAPAALVGAVGYLTPVFSLGWGVLLFSQIPSLYALIGSMLILLFGVLLPFLR